MSVFQQPVRPIRATCQVAGLCSNPFIWPNHNLSFGQCPGLQGYAYVSFDDDVLRASAQADPAGFVADLPDKVVLDEAQRVPALFTSIKAAVDRDRRPGRFILTGSANVLLVPRLADSLAGWLEILRLHPLAQAELAHKPPGFLDALFDAGFKARTRSRLGPELLERIAGGGYPAALARPAARRRAAWCRDYMDSPLPASLISSKWMRSRVSLR